MNLKVPQCWNDEGLLGNQAFNDLFATRSLASEGRGRKSGMNWDKHIAEQVQGLSGGLDAVQAWLDIVFYAIEDEVRHVRNTPTSENLEVFVKVFWLIYQKDERAALVLVNRERKKRGCWWGFDVNPRKSRPITQCTSARSMDAASKAETSGVGGDVGVPSLDADADVSSVFGSSTLEYMSEEEKGDMLLYSDIPVVSPGLGLSTEVAEGSFPVEDGGQATRSEVASGLRGQKRRATAEDISSLEHSSMDIANEDPVPAQSAKNSSASCALSSLPESLASAISSRVHFESKTIATQTSDTLPPPSSSMRSKARALNPSETHASQQVESRGKTKRNIPRGPGKAKPSARGTKLQRVDHSGSESDYDDTRKAILNAPRRETRSLTTRESKLKQTAMSRSSTHRLQPTESPNTNSGRQSGRLPKIATAISAPRNSIHPPSSRMGEVGSKRSATRNGSSRKSGTTANSKTAKSIHRSTREPSLPMRPQKRRRTKADEEIHLSMSAPTLPMNESTTGKCNSTELSPTKKRVTRASHDPEPARELPENGKDPSVPIPRVGEQHSEIDLSRASLTDHTVVKGTTGKRKERIDDSQDQTPRLGLSTIVQSQFERSRPIAKLPAQHLLYLQPATLAKQPMSGGRTAHDPMPKIIEQVIQDAAADALLVLNDPPVPLADWTNDDNASDQDLDSAYESHIDADPGDLSSNIVTVRDHEADSKPTLSTNPPIWAQSRQEVCESFDWFRSYQGGVYFANDIVKGYLLSAFASSRDVFHHGGRLIISHGGGKSESLHSRDGRMQTQMAEDQLAQDKSVRALIRNHKENRPLVLLADDRYKHFPYNLPAGCTYVVLGFYCITHVWAESNSASNDRGRVVRYKFAFQWCESQGEPWWTTHSSMNMTQDEIAVDHLDTAALSGDHSVAATPPARPSPVKIAVGAPVIQIPSAPREIYSKCERCKFDYPQVYHQGWLCLTPECSAFWAMKDGEVPRGLLSYTSKFLELKPKQSLPSNLPELYPKPPPTGGWDNITTAYVFTKGWHCRQCGRLSSRYKWSHWECANCGNRLPTTGGRLRSPKEFWTQLDQCTNHRIGSDSGIIKPHSELYDVGGARGEYIMYILPQNRGRIHLIRGNPRTNVDADAIFQQYQIQATSGALPFRRFPMRAHKCRGTLLTNYFSQNSGEPYQYVGGTDNTVPFKDAASAVVDAMKLIQARAEAALKKRPEFNEILSAAYMERQKMAFHSDSEPGLGPVVASLSLGSAAIMHFRLHARYRKDGEGKENALTLTLRHGDVLVMEGTGVQDCYEHTVIPCNFRVAATARWIGGA